ncbi:MAG: hypothetical protein ABL961_06615 [Vicinamibacterales bacterium]
MARFERLGLGVIGAVAALATIWLFLTNPVSVATAVSGGEVTPFIRDLADVILQALRAILDYL